MGRQHRHRTVGEDVDLDAGAGAACAPPISSSTTAAGPEVGRRTTGGATPAGRATRSALGIRRPTGSRTETTTLPSPAPLLSCLTTTPSTPGRVARGCAATASTTPARSRTSSTPDGRRAPRPRGTACRPALLKPSGHRAGSVPLIGRAERPGDLDLGVGDVPRLDEAGAGPPVRLAEPVDEIRAVEQLGRHRRGGAVVHDEDVSRSSSPRRAGRARPAGRSSRAPRARGPPQLTKTSSHPGIRGSMRAPSRYRCS